MQVIDQVTEIPAPETPEVLRNLRNMKKLRHVIRAFELEIHAVAARGWDWSRLLHDIDISLERFSHRFEAKKGCKRFGYDIQTATLQADVRLPTKRAKLGGSQAQAIEKAAWVKWDIHAGDVLSVRYFKKQLRGTVVQVCPGKTMAKVHYMGWPAYYDEFQPLESLMLADDTAKEGKRVAVNDAVMVKWGASQDAYRSQVLSICTMDTIQIHNANYGDAWNQWITASQIIRKLD